MSKTDSLQLNAIYAYIKKNKKPLVLYTKCNVCKKKFNKYEFYTNTHVCKSCWLEYVGMTRAEKRNLQDEKMG